MKNSTRLIQSLLPSILLALMMSPMLSSAADLPDGFCSENVDPGFFTCTTGDSLDCTDALNHLDDYKQILIFPTGYQRQVDFEADAELLRVDSSVTNRAPGIWTKDYAANLLYLTYWVEGGAVGDPDAAFAGHLAPLWGTGEPDPGSGDLSIDDSALYDYVATMQETCPRLDPLLATVLFDYERPLGASAISNATPPGYTGPSYGIARILHSELKGYKAGRHYIGPHEFSHAAFGWHDEYLRGPIYDEMDVHDIDVLTPLLILDRGLPDVIQDLTGVYDMRLSEILFGNGSDNVSIVPNPGRVSPGTAQGSEDYLHQGATFLEGVYRFEDWFSDDDGNLILLPDENGSGIDVPNKWGNIMTENGTYWGDNYQPDHRRHSPSQQRLVDFVFGTGEARANDRLVNQGPPSGFSRALGPQWQIMLFDEDKNHVFHPTLRYDVQVQWDETNLTICRRTAWPYLNYPCFKTETKTVQKSIAPTREVTDLTATDLWAMGGWAVDLLCGLGDGTLLLLAVDLCSAPGLDPVSDAQPIPSLVLPYQKLMIPTPRAFTKYQWRFRSDNGHATTGWTEWSELSRSL